MANKPKVAIIIVNWNGLEYLKLSLPSLERQTYSALRIYVVDNKSTDDSIAYMKQYWPDVTVIEADKNLGFAEGNNIGIELALSDGADYVMLLNNDTEVKANMVKQLVDFMEKYPKVGIAQPKLLLLDYRDTIDSCGSWLTKTGFLIHYGCEEKDAPKYNKVQPMFTIKGAAMIMRRALVEEVGMLDPDFFAYFEETDLCWRAWLLGWKVYYAPVTTVYHKIGGSTKKIGSPIINYHSFKNRIMSLIKNLSWYNALWMVPLHLLLVLGFSLIYFAALRGRSGLSIYRAIGWNITHLGSTLRKRRMIQKLRKISDKQLFKTIVRPVDWQESIDFGRRYFVGRRKTDMIAAGDWKGR